MEKKPKRPSEDPLRVWERHICYLIDKGLVHFSKEVILRRSNKKKDKD